MMTIEDKLKNLIKSRYGSVREFTIMADMPYSTVATIFSRGVENSSVNNIIKICKELNISADALADGKIVPVNTEDKEITEFREIINELKYKVMSCDELTLDGVPVNEFNRDGIVQALEIVIEIVKRHLQD